MQNTTYLKSLQEHYERHFGVPGTRQVWSIDPHKKMHPDFYILEFAPNKKHHMWAFCTVGMSLEHDENLIELFIYSPIKHENLIELLTIVASYHRNDAPLNLHHTFNIGQPWLGDSRCTYGFISLPYLDGEVLEIFNFGEKTIHCYWIIPITERERNFKIEHGYDALEDLFEEKEIDYLNPDRKSLV